MSYQDKIKTGIDSLLEKLSTRPDVAKTTALLAVEMHTDVERVLEWIQRARAAGHLIIENNRGYYIAPDYESFCAWRKQVVIPDLVYTLDMLHAMGMAAKRQFNVPGIDPEDLYVQDIPS
jgi:hypothetical protein